LKTLKISKDEIKDYEKLKIISQIALVKTKIELFEKRYNCSFKDFDKKIKKTKHEDFEKWDDYIEWKSYVESLQDLDQKIREIDDAEDITVT
jgi:hypothetical protein